MSLTQLTPLLPLLQLLYLECGFASSDIFPQLSHTRRSSVPFSQGGIHTSINTVLLFHGGRMLRSDGVRWLEGFLFFYDCPSLASLFANLPGSDCLSFPTHHGARKSASFSAPGKCERQLLLLHLSLGTAHSRDMATAILGLSTLEPPSRHVWSPSHKAPARPCSVQGMGRPFGLQVGERSVAGLFERGLGCW